MIGKMALTGGLAAVSLIALAAPAHAATQIYSFTSADSSAGLGAGPFGTVTVTEDGSGGLNFLMTLASGYRIHRGNANHNAFTFSLAGNPAVSITGLPSGFSAVSLATNTSVDAPPFATGFTGIKCAAPACGPGYNGGFEGPLSFKVMSSTTSLTLNSLIARTNNFASVYFTTDLVRANGKTGNVGAFRVGPPVPEPSTWALLILGFGMVGAGMRRRSGVRTAVSYS